MIDPDNPVVRLCSEGIAATTSDRAHVLYRRAWELATEPFEAAIAAHYLARAASSPEVALAWNETAFERAKLDTTGRVRSILASLHLCLGKSFEDTGNAAEALRHYARGETVLDELAGEPGYREMIARGLASGIRRVVG